MHLHTRVIPYKCWYIYIYILTYMNTIIWYILFLLNTIHYTFCAIPITSNVLAKPISVSTKTVVYFEIMNQWHDWVWCGCVLYYYNNVLLYYCVTVLYFFFWNLGAHGPHVYYYNTHRWRCELPVYRGGDSKGVY